MTASVGITDGEAEGATDNTSVVLIVTTVGDNEGVSVIIALGNGAGVGGTIGDTDGKVVTGCNTGASVC